MGKFADAAGQYVPGKRGDGYCAAGRWIADNFDDEDLAEFVRLANAHSWKLIQRLSDFNLKEKCLYQHVHGTCPCFDGLAAKGCCTHLDEESS